MRHLTVLISIAIALTLLASEIAYAAPAQAVKIEVQAGFDGYYKIGEWIPIAITLSNDGPDLEGKVWVEAPDESGGKTVYARTLSLPSKSRKLVYLYSNTTGFTRDIQVNFQVKDEIVSSAKAVLRPLQPYDYLIGIVGSDPSAGNFLSSMKFASLQPQGDGRATVAHFALAQLPPRAQAMDSLDVLVLSDVSTAEIEAEQRQALDNWISSGGILLVAGGAGGQKVASGLQSLLPFKVSGTRSLDAVSGLEELAGSPLKASGPFLATVASDVKNASVLAEQDGIPLVVQRTIGQGRFVFLALDINVPPLNSWLGDGLLWKRILAPDTSVAFSSGLNVRTGISGAMQSALTNVPTMDLPAVTTLAMFLLVYILSIGPVNYFVLRRFDRREWAWLTIPALTLAFTGSAYAMGFGMKGGNIVVHEITLLRGGYSSPVAEAETYFGIFSPVRQTYQIEVGDDMLISKPLPFGMPTSAGDSEVFQGEPAQVKDANVNAWSMQTFMAEGFVKLDGAGIQSDLYVANDRIVGKITNSTGVALEDVVLLKGSSVTRLGTINPGETKNVDGAGTSGDSGWDMSPSSVILGMPQPFVGGGDNRDEMRKRMIVDSALGFPGRLPGSWSSSALTLVGWQRNSPVDIVLSGQKATRQSTVLLMMPLPVALGSNNVSVPAGFTTKSLLESTTSRAGAAPFGFSLAEGSVTVRYQLPPEASKLTVKELLLHFQQQQAKMAPGASTQPSLELYDWNRGKWVDRGKISADVTPIAEPASFVSSSGAIEARLTAPPGGYLMVSQFDFSVKGER